MLKKPTYYCKTNNYPLMIISKMLTGYYNRENKASIVAFNIPKDVAVSK